MSAQILQFPKKEEPKPIQQHLVCVACKSKAFQIMSGSLDLYCYTCGAYVSNVALRWR